MLSTEERKKCEALLKTLEKTDEEEEFIRPVVQSNIII